MRKNRAMPPKNSRIKKARKAVVLKKCQKASGSRTICEKDRDGAAASAVLTLEKSAGSASRIGNLKKRIIRLRKKSKASITQAAWQY